MTCHEAQNKINAYLNDQLLDEEMISFLNHVESCKACRGELELYFTLDHTLKALDQDYPLDQMNFSDMLSRRMAHSRQEVVERKSNRYIFAFLIGLAELMVLLVLIMFQLDVSGAAFVQYVSDWFHSLQWSDVVKLYQEIIGSINIFG